MINELFKPGIAGSSLRQALVDLMNMIMGSLYIPEYMQLADSTSIYKNKRSRMDLTNWEWSYSKFS